MEGWSAGEELAWADTMTIPLLGVVAAGQPYEAFAVEETLSVPTTLWSGRRVFALHVRGNSMVDEGIHHGDYLIVEPRQAADNGQTVVAEIDGCVTVKKYFCDAQGTVRLQPANPAVLPLVVRAQHVRIIGVVAGILRKFGFGNTHPLPGVGETAGLRAQRPALKPRRPAARIEDSASIDLAVNAIDQQLSRWNAAIAHAKRDRRLQRQMVHMAELGRDLQSLRDWCARTSKPGLRRALLAEANRVMRRMQRVPPVTPEDLPDSVLH